VVLLSSHIRNLSDAELVAKYKETGENICVGELFRRYMHLVYGVCMKYLKEEDKAKDLQSHIFERLLSDLLKHEVANFKGWLFSVTKNHCLMYLRSNQSLQKNLKTLKKDMQPDVESAFDLHHNPVLEKEKQLNKLETGIAQLNDDQRKCVDLFYIKEKSYREIVELTGYSLNDVKSYIQNGKRNLKLFMQQHNER
jgi:RNA polymerase sigma factor (sigma-70 family)